MARQHAVRHVVVGDIKGRVAFREVFSQAVVIGVKRLQQYQGINTMAAPPPTSDLSREDLEAQVAQQGSLVRELKKSKAPTEEIKAAVAELLRRKEAMAAFDAANARPQFDKQGFEDLMKRRFFFAPSFEIYGGVAGLYDYGPTGCAIMANMIAEWRQHFVLEENMLEVNCTAMTPHYVLEASGHAARFADIMVRDVKTGDCHRADHLLEDVMHNIATAPDTSAELKKECEKIGRLADSYSKAELWDLYKRFDIKSPTTGNDLSEPVDFNMMFQTQIGPTGHLAGFLRPETAQGIFLAFKRLYEFNNFKLPFAGAQIGTAFRNEISPKAGLLRVREFQMAEIEHFLDPTDKSHARFDRVKDVCPPLYTANAQQAGEKITRMSIGDAVAQGIIANETLGYFVGRIFQFMVHIGVDQERIRFRQHLPTEMAHYACDCWDCELETSYGWIECVGCADRSCYDLEQHAKAAKQPILASVPLKEPLIKDVVVVEANKGLVGKAFRQNAKVVFAHFEAMSNEEAEQFEKDLQNGPVTLKLEAGEFEIQPAWITIKRKQVKEHERKFVPSVIEPSFGLGRIIYALLEHSFECREGDAQRTWLRLAPLVAPVKCSVLPLSNNAEFNPFLDELVLALTRAGVSTRRDDSAASIGKRYARTDEIGIPFGVTVDFDTIKDRTVTFRFRDTMEQIRLSIWRGQLPVRFTYVNASDDAIEPCHVRIRPRIHFRFQLNRLTQRTDLMELLRLTQMLVPRLAYLPFCLEQIAEHYRSIPLINSLAVLRQSSDVAAVLANDYERFNQINASLTGTEGDGAWFKHVPYVVYLTQGDSSNAAVTFETTTEPFPTIDENGVPWCLQDLLTWLLPDQFPPQTKESTGEELAEQVLIQGIQLPLNTPLQWLAQHMCHADNFVHIIVSQATNATNA
ncbi:uncharacterized protein MONBRDRAFT_37647 [Monosiga brevicollis MX1]|uniref:glycine--tRNA ligase n=1 Tax=Monosiga brevicollis TaxID=81824 RepID=A9V317_MONBE|nr:uncharacterized protein MONBRDRAFT_37647 [Monosiga brevicollis MX1]EDQ88108.1 predicted protein [Monosiga brevicollis MX1]|eukprot:XP_001747184.1 hypothetical protein [Monosiga brevicollis MX1]